MKNLVLVTVAPDLFLCLLEQELLDLLLLPLDLEDLDLLEHERRLERLLLQDLFFEEHDFLVEHDF